MFKPYQDWSSRTSLLSSWKKLPSTKLSLRPSPVNVDVSVGKVQHFSSDDSSIPSCDVSLRTFILSSSVDEYSIKKKKQLPVNMGNSDYNLDSLIAWCSNLRMLIRATAYFLWMLERRPGETRLIVWMTTSNKVRLADLSLMTPGNFWYLGNKAKDWTERNVKFFVQWRSTFHFRTIQLLSRRS